MDSLDKMVAVLLKLHDHNAIPRPLQRVEFKPVKSGHWRLYFATPLGFAKPNMAILLEMLKDDKVDVNGFSSGGKVTAVTIVDSDEAEA